MNWKIAPSVTCQSLVWGKEGWSGQQCHRHRHLLHQRPCRHHHHFPLNKYYKKAFDIQIKGERLDSIGRAICNPYFYHSMVFLINNAKNHHFCELPPSVTRMALVSTRGWRLMYNLSKTPSSTNKSFSRPLISCPILIRG